MAGDPCARLKPSGTPSFGNNPWLAATSHFKPPVGRKSGYSCQGAVWAGGRGGVGELKGRLDSARQWTVAVKAVNLK